jgi:hypothetical protein
MNFSITLFEGLHPEYNFFRGNFLAFWHNNSVFVKEAFSYRDCRGKCFHLLCSLISFLKDQVTSAGPIIRFLSSLGVGWDWVHLVRRPLFDLLYQPQMIYDDDDCGAFGGMRISRGNRSTQRNPAPVPLCPRQILHDLTWNRTRAAAVGSRLQTATTMAQSPLFVNVIPSFSIYAITSLLFTWVVYSVIHSGSVVLDCRLCAWLRWWRLSLLIKYFRVLIMYMHTIVPLLICKAIRPVLYTVPSGVLAMTWSCMISPPPPNH